MDRTDNGRINELFLVEKNGKRGMSRRNDLRRILHSLKNEEFQKELGETS